MEIIMLNNFIPDTSKPTSTDSFDIKATCNPRYTKTNISQRNARTFAILVVAVCESVLMLW